MSHDPRGLVSPWIDQVGSVRRWVVPAAVVVALLIVVHGAIHVLPLPGGRPHLPTRDVVVLLWGLTTLTLAGGFILLGWSYSELVNGLRSDPPWDIGILPENERRILGPVLDAPGITQVEVVDRSGFSDAKVSQTLKTLRERGLVYRERQGRTYRLYPGTKLDETAHRS